MGQVIFFLLALFIVISALKWSAKALRKVPLFFVMAILLPPYASGLGMERILNRLRGRMIGGVVVASGSLIFASAWVVFDYHPFFDARSFGALKYIPAVLFFWLLLIFHVKRVTTTRKQCSFDFLLPQTSRFYEIYFASFCSLAVSAALPCLHTVAEFRHAVWVSYAGFTYWLLAVFLQLYAIFFERNIARIVRDLAVVFSRSEKLERSSEFLRSLKEKYPGLSDHDVQLVFNGLAANLIRSGLLIEKQLGASSWFFARPYFERSLGNVSVALASRTKTSKDVVRKYVQHSLGLPSEPSHLLADFHLEFGDYYDFEDDSYFVVFENSDHINQCICCGLTIEVNSSDQGTWYCSDTCRQTERTCEVVASKHYEEFTQDAVTAGFQLMSGGAAWSSNHKIFAAGGQGHGFAAERANTRVDWLHGRKSKVVGDDNAKNGADRLVNGIEVQTKYCKKGTRSIGAAFEGSEGDFKYFDSTGAPMTIEVPRDQYDDALKEMRNRIAKGKVKGVTDPNQAEQLVRKGHLTHQQAVNITKFGTFESLTYDAAEGVVIGTAAGGISFCITATLYYLQTDNIDEAIKIAALEAGKTFGKTLVVYVAAQQLHRLSLVQSAVSSIDIGSFSPAVREAIKNGLGVKSTNAANRALGGTAVTGAVLIAITTGPDFAKMVVGRVSGAQFIKNMAVSTSAIAGGSLGAIAGGAAGASLGPFGIYLGQVAGGIVGGWLTSTIVNEYSKSYMREDAEVVMDIVSIQIRYLAKTFMLTEKEIECLNFNVQQAFTKSVIERIFQAKRQRRAMANFFVKPLVVGVVRQRPAITYTANDVVDTCIELAQ